MYTLLNSDRNRDQINLNKHHWGNREIPVHNVVVMIKDKPREQFSYVKVKSLKELIDYITRFDTLFDVSEVEKISRFLTHLQS
jgi:hypothetical protein